MSRNVGTLHVQHPFLSPLLTVCVPLSEAFSSLPVKSSNATPGLHMHHVMAIDTYSYTGLSILCPTTELGVCRIRCAPVYHPRPQCATPTKLCVFAHVSFLKQQLVDRLQKRGSWQKI